MKEEFQARLLRIYFTEADKWHDKPLYKAIVEKCMELGLAGATVYRGLEGFGASARIHHSWNLSISKNAPIMMTIIDTEEQIQKLIPHLDQMIGGGLVASSTVQAVRYIRSTQDPSVNR